jgi:hypothetical protein
MVTLPTGVSRASPVWIRCQQMDEEETKRYVSQVLLLFIVSMFPPLQSYFSLQVALLPPSWIDLEAEVPSQRTQRDRDPQLSIKLTRWISTLAMSRTQKSFFRTRKLYLQVAAIVIHDRPLS